MRALSVESLNDRLLAASFVPEKLEGGWLWMKEAVLSQTQATQIMRKLREETVWSQPKIGMGAKLINSPRLAAWHGDSCAIYTYSGLRNIPRPWTDPLLELRSLLAELTGLDFNSVLLNLYRDGSDSMGWHSDNEPELGDEPTIASISFGEKRKFLMKHNKLNCRNALELTHGSVLIMAGQTQRWWRHSVPKSKTRHGERINLTFRKIVCLAPPSVP